MVYWTAWEPISAQFALYNNKKEETMRIFEPYGFSCPDCGAKLRSDNEGLMACPGCRKVFEVGQNRHLVKQNKYYRNALAKSAPDVYTVATFSYSGDTVKKEQRALACVFDYGARDKNAESNRAVYLPIAVNVAKAPDFLVVLIKHEEEYKRYRERIAALVASSGPTDKRGGEINLKSEYERITEHLDPSAELREAVERSEELYCRGASYYYDGKFSEAVEDLRAAAEMGHIKAQYLLAMCYASGDGVERNVDSCIKWMKEAADQGDQDAQFELGMIYSNSKIGVKDMAESARWHRKAAEQGDKRSQGLLGVYYLNGIGVRQSDSDAVLWVRKAAAQGFPEAQCMLGAVYADGRGVIKNRDEARKWYKKAIAQGNDLAVEQLESMEREIAAERRRIDEQNRASAMRYAARTQSPNNTGITGNAYSNNRSNPNGGYSGNYTRKTQKPVSKGKTNWCIFVVLLFTTGIGGWIYLLVTGSKTTRIVVLIITVVFIVIAAGTGACSSCMRLTDLKAFTAGL